MPCGGSIVQAFKAASQIVQRFHSVSAVQSLRSVQAVTATLSFKVPGSTFKVRFGVGLARFDNSQNVETFYKCKG